MDYLSARIVPNKRRLDSLAWPTAWPSRKPLIQHRLFAIPGKTSPSRSGRFVVYIPQTYEERTDAGVQKSPHQLHSGLEIMSR